MTSPDVSQLVREKYGEAARRVLHVAEPAAASCCGGAAFNGTVDPITSNLYVNGETDELPNAAVLASLGCGNPTALAELREGEVVLDLGSGGGIDVLLSARRVGATGKAYGLDMTDDMLALAKRNAAEAGVTNVEFLRGRIEEIPLPSASVDVIISNCVINLSGDKRRVLAEAFRVLKPGGRFAVSDVVVRGEVPAEVRRSMELWVGCVAGALEEQEFRTLLAENGFSDIDIEATRVYKAEDACVFLQDSGIDVRANLEQIDGKFMAAFVRATKPHDAPSPIPSIRRATKDDLMAVEALLRERSLPTDGVAALFAADPTQFVVATDGTVVIGVAGVEACGDDGLLRSVAVRHDWQHRDVGRHLVTRALNDAEARGISALYLLTTTAEDYFPRFGFTRIARSDVPAGVANTVEFMSACPASATVMCRLMPNTA